jgi:ubiquitin-like domain-containing CTD phosphatase 1
MLLQLMLQEKTRILPKRQKLVGLVALNGGAKGVTDDLPLSGLKCKQAAASAATAAKNNNTSSSGSTALTVPTVTTMAVTHQFILMGTPEEAIFIDPSDRDDLPDVVDDFDLDFNAGSDGKFSVLSGDGARKSSPFLVI